MKVLTPAYRIIPLYTLGDLSKWIECNPDRALGECIDLGLGILAGLPYSRVQPRAAPDDPP